MAYRNTRYKVVIRKNGYEQTLGYTPRVSKLGLFRIMKHHAERIIELTKITDDDEMKWNHHPHVHVIINDWYIGFDGTTEKHP